MNNDLMSSIRYLLLAVPTSPRHDQLDVTIYENGFPTSSTLPTPVLSDSGLSEAYICPKLFVAIRSVLVHAAIRWPTMIPAHQIVDSLREALLIIGECQVVFCRSELALLVSADSAQDIISYCHSHNNSIPWDTLMYLDAQTKQTVHSNNVPVVPREYYLNPEVLQMHDTATYEPMVRPNDLVNGYDGPLFEDWEAYQTSCESYSNTAEPHHYPYEMYSLSPGAYPVEFDILDTLPRDISVTLGESNFAPLSEYPETLTIDFNGGTSDFSSPSSTRSSPFPETPALDGFRSELPHIVSPMLTVVRDVTRQEEQHADKVTQIDYPTYPASPGSVVALSPLSECESLPSSRCSSTDPSSQSSECGSTSSPSSEETIQAPVKAVGKKVRRTKTGAIRKKKTKSKEKHFCQYCNESFTRDHDAERHQRTCKSNPNCSQKEQCKVCMKPLPVRLDARRRHWSTLECSDAARKQGFTRMDEERYELVL